MLPWPEAADSRLLWITFLMLLFLATWVGLSRADPGLEHSPFKRPMLAFEMAGSVEESRRVIELSERADKGAAGEVSHRAPMGFRLPFSLSGLNGCGLLYRHQILLSQSVPGLQVWIDVDLFAVFGSHTRCGGEYGALKNFTRAGGKSLATSGAVVRHTEVYYRRRQHSLCALRWRCLDADSFIQPLNDPEQVCRYGRAA